MSRPGEMVQMDCFFIGRRVQETILDECWKPAFARYLIPKYTGLRMDLDRYLDYYG